MIDSIIFATVYRTRHRIQHDYSNIAERKWRINPEKILDLPDDFDLQEDQEQKVKLRLAWFLKKLEAEPKSSEWKIRLEVGERNRWYEPVEEARA